MVTSILGPVAAPPSGRRPSYAASGVLATLLGMATGHAVAAGLDPASSPVLAVGSAVIDLTPTPVKEFAVRTFGTYDKPILIGSVMLGTLVLAAVAGLVAKRRPALGAGLLLLLVAVAGLVALVRPAATVTDAVPAVASAAAGVAALVWLVSRLGPSQLLTSNCGRIADGRAAGARYVDSYSPVTGQGLGERRGADPAPSRRGFLVASGVVAASAAVLGTLGTWVARARSVVADFVIPRAADPGPALPTGLDQKVPGITPFRTPAADFYRVDTKLTVPVVQVADWRLTIDGDVENPLDLSLDDLLEMPLMERDITLNCVSNEVGGPYVSSARWTGVPLRDLLERAGVGDGADQILSTDVEGFTISTPLEVALDGRDTMVVIGMNGEPLPPERGYPARLLTPGLYGYVGATKWLQKLTLTTYDAEEAYWTERGWAIDAPVKIASRIDTPEPLATLSPGRTVIAGIAWAQRRGIGDVEVRTDGGAWQRAELGPDAGVDYWRQWFLRWDAEPGRHLLAVRATTVEGDVQTAARTKPFPNGSSGIQEIVVTVA